MGNCHNPPARRHFRQVPSLDVPLPGPSPSTHGHTSGSSASSPTLPLPRRAVVGPLFARERHNPHCYKPDSPGQQLLSDLSVPRRFPKNLGELKWLALWLLCPCCVLWAFPPARPWSF